MNENQNEEVSVEQEEAVETDDNVDEESNEEEVLEEEWEEKVPDKSTSNDEDIKSDKPVAYSTFDKKTIIIIATVLVILYGLYVYFTFFQ